MWTRRALVLFGLIVGLLAPGFSAAIAQDFRIEDVQRGAQSAMWRQLKPGTIEFSDHTSVGTVDSETALFAFDDWASKHPAEKKFLALFPAIPSRPSARAVNGSTAQVTEKLDMYVAQARFILDRAPGAIDLSRYVTLPSWKRSIPRSSTN